MVVVHAVITWLWINTAGNLVASAITTGLGLWLHHRRLKRHHTAELDKLRKHLLGALADQRQRGGDR